jgi:hypothetical protein
MGTIRIRARSAQKLIAQSQSMAGESNYFELDTQQASSRTSRRCQQLTDRRRRKFTDSRYIRTIQLNIGCSDAQSVELKNLGTPPPKLTKLKKLPRTPRFSWRRWPVFYI